METGAFREWVLGSKDKDFEFSTGDRLFSRVSGSFSWEWWILKCLLFHRAVLSHWGVDVIFSAWLANWGRLCRGGSVVLDLATCLRSGSWLLSEDE